MTYQEWAKAVAEAGRVVEAARTQYLVDCLRVADSATFEVSRLVRSPELDSNFVGALELCVSDAARSGRDLRDAWAAKAALLVTEYDEPEDEAATAPAELNAIEVKP